MRKGLESSVWGGSFLLIGSYVGPIQCLTRVMEKKLRADPYSVNLALYKQVFRGSKLRQADYRDGFLKVCVRNVLLVSGRPFGGERL